jgi:PAS domain S-box-containing protein
MHKKPANFHTKHSISNKSRAETSNDILHRLAFDNSLQANIISTVNGGKIVLANRAACKLLGYSLKELLTKSRSGIFDIKENSFKKMLKQRRTKGYSSALATAIQKSGKILPCEITSAVFLDQNGIEKAITTIADMRQSILKQKNIDIIKERIVADNIVLAKSKQKNIDTKKEKIVADNITIAYSKQKVIDTQNEKIVADNIVIAKSRQKDIDIKREQIVAKNIILAKLKQKDIDTEKEKVVADNITLAQAKSDAILVENSEWIKYIAETSYDVMWDWDIVSGEIYVGDSIHEVFGYKLQNNRVEFKDFTGCLLPEEKDTVEKKLLKTLASGNKSWSDSYMFKRQDGSVAATNSRGNIVRDDKGKAIRLIGAIQDVSKLQKLEKKVSEQITIHKEDKQRFHLATKLSFDVIWDWNILTNEMFIGEGFEELFGYSLRNNKGNLTDWIAHIHPDDKEAIEKELEVAIASSNANWERAYRFTRSDGTIARVFGRGSIIRQIDGKAYRMIGAMHDLGQQKESEEKLDLEIVTKGKLFTEYKERFKLIFNTSSDVLFDVDLIANEVTISDAYEKDFGYNTSGRMTPEENWISHIHPDDKQAVLYEYLRVLASDEIEWKYDYRFIRADNSVANISSFAIILRNSNGKAFRMIGSMQDLSEQRVLEERLSQEIKLKEKQIANAREEAKESERSDIGRELHDNVNQLLCVSGLYLDMAKRGGKDSEIYLSRSSEYTLTAIEEIRKLTSGLTTDIIKKLGLCEAIKKVTRDTMEVNKVKISNALDNLIENRVNETFKLNVFRIVQEQLNNILKHAKATEVTISLSQNKNSITLCISDNGIGFDTGKKRDGIGIANIMSRAEANHGVAEFVSQPGEGCILTVVFPITDSLLDNS